MKEKIILVKEYLEGQAKILDCIINNIDEYNDFYTDNKIFSILEDLPHFIHDTIDIVLGKKSV